MSDTKYQYVQVGIFKMPGIKIASKEIPDELDKAMDEWASKNKCGTRMTPQLWSFKSKAKRDWFLMRWVDEFPEFNEDD